MAESKLQTVLNTLPTLGATELEQVRVRTLALLKLSGVTVPNATRGKAADPDVEMVMEVIHDVLREHGLMVRQEQLHTTAAYQTFAKKVPAIMAYLRQCVTNKNQHKAILRIGFELIHRYLAKQSLPAGTRVMMAHVHRIPEVIDTQFPGYAAEGMLGWIARRAHVRPQ